MSDSGGKAYFLVEGKGSDEAFTLQYNPKELKFTRSISWQKKEEIGPDRVPIKYQQGDPNVLSMELFFDTTHEDSPVDVRKAWVDGLMELTKADYQPSGEDVERPRILEFRWSGFEYKGVIEKIDVMYLMFASDGTPLRAKVALSLKEWSDNYQYERNTSRHELPDLDLVVTKAGDTASSVAQETGADVRQVCEDNDIDDPMAELDAGIELVVDSGIWI